MLGKQSEKKMQIVDIKELVADRDLCKKLVDLGLIEASALYWSDRGSVEATANIIDEMMYYCPAYTMEELLIAIGGTVFPPVLPEPRPKGNEDEDITWRFYFTDKFKEYRNGATAAADVLIYCLEKSILELDKVNNRLERKFKPF